MWSTTESERNEICRAISALHQPRVLEIGAFKGETTRALAQAAAERSGYVVVIDPMRWAAEVVANGIARHMPSGMSALTTAVETILGDAGYEAAFWETVGTFRPQVRLQRSLSGAPDLVASPARELQQFDVVFIDGDHSREGAAADLSNWGRRTAPGGSIFVHDAVRRFPGVLEALREFSAEQGLPVSYPIVGSLASIRVTHALAPTSRRVEAPAQQASVHPPRAS